MVCDQYLHVIAFNVPYPANYGGVIDVFYKIKALSEAGVRIHLHCYKYGREESDVLAALCDKVTYYKRRIYRDPFFIKLPYIVASRNSSDLLNNLLKDDAPILFEGLHCCYYLTHPALKDRCKIVRTHNLEDIYYKNLAKIEKNMVKKYFFSIESDRLRQFEKVLQHATSVAAISPNDSKILNLRYGNVFYLPVFHSNDSLSSIVGHGEYAFYHGNLGVGENNEAVMYLIKEVFNKPFYPFYIAGMNPSRELKKAVEENEHIKLFNKLDTEGIQNMTRQAHINILPTFQNTGMKLKLINVLFQGRHILVNSKMVSNTGLEPLCHIADTPAQMIDEVLKLSKLGFTEQNRQARIDYLNAHFSNKANALLLLEHVFSAKLV